MFFGVTFLILRLKRKHCWPHTSHGKPYLYGFQLARASVSSMLEETSMSIYARYAMTVLEVFHVDTASGAYMRASGSFLSEPRWVIQGVTDPEPGFITPL